MSFASKERAMIFASGPSIVLHIGDFIFIGFLNRLHEQSDVGVRFQLVGPRQNNDDPYSAYSLFVNQPESDSDEPFPQLYFRIQELVEQGELEGPTGDDHPALFNRFNWIARRMTMHDILVALQNMGYAIRITRIARHTKTQTEKAKDEEDARIAVIRETLAQWIDADTEIDEREPSWQEKLARESAQYQEVSGWIIVWCIAKFLAIPVVAIVLLISLLVWIF
jgi:hypothetical protein